MKRIIPIAAASLMAGTMLASPAFAQDKKLEEGASASGTVDATGEAGATAKTDRPAGTGASAEAQTGTSAEGTVEVKPNEQAGSTSGTADGRQQLDADADAEAGSQDMQAEQDAGAASDGQQQAGEGTDAASEDRQQAGQETEGAEGEAEMSAEGEDVSGETTASINLSSEQETELRTVFSEPEVEPAEIDVDVSIGTAIPQTVTLHPLPPRVIEIVPQYEDYEYFVLADGRIIIVEPDTYEVVYIIVV